MLKTLKSKKYIFYIVIPIIILSVIGLLILRHYYQSDELIYNEIVAIVMEQGEKYNKVDIHNVDYTFVSSEKSIYAIVTYDYTDGISKKDLQAQSLYSVDRTWYGKYVLEGYVTIYGATTPMNNNYYDNDHMIFWGLNEEAFDTIKITTNTGYSEEIDLPSTKGYVIIYNYLDIKDATDYDSDDYPFINIDYNNK